MDKKRIGITSATIEGLDKKPYHFKEKCCWAWNLLFSDRPSTFLNLCAMYMGKNKTEALETYYSFKNTFTDNFIFDGDRVAVIYDDAGIVAIGKNGKDSWIDVRDKFKEKTFKELNLIIESLVVECNY